MDNPISIIIKLGEKTVGKTIEEKAIGAKQGQILEPIQGNLYMGTKNCSFGENNAYLTNKLMIKSSNVAKEVFIHF